MGLAQYHPAPAPGGMGDIKDLKHRCDSVLGRRGAVFLSRRVHFILLQINRGWIFQGGKLASSRTVVVFCIC